MSKIAYQISCKNCGGFFPKIAGERIVSCPYCSKNSLIKSENEYQRFYIEAKIEKHDALKRAREVFSVKNASKNLKVEALPLDSKLYYIPFHVVSFFRSAQIEVEKESTVSQKEASWDWLSEQDNHFHFFKKAGLDEPETKTKVIYERTKKVIPAVHFHDFKFDPSAVYRHLFNKDGFSLKPAYMPDLQQKGYTFEPADEPDINKLIAGYDEVKTKIFGIRVEIVYYPLWVINYTYKKRIFPVISDGISGELLFWEVPENETYKIRWGFLLLGSVGFLSSKFMKIILLSKTSFSPAMVWLITIILFCIIFTIPLIPMVWYYFRYPSYIVFNNGEIEVVEEVKLQSERYSEFISNILKGSFKK